MLCIKKNNKRIKYSRKCNISKGHCINIINKMTVGKILGRSNLQKTGPGTMLDSIKPGKKCHSHKI